MMDRLGQKEITVNNASASNINQFWSMGLKHQVILIAGGNPGVT